MDIKVNKNANGNSAKTAPTAMIKTVQPNIQKTSNLKTLKFFELFLLYSSLIVIVCLLLLIYLGGNKASNYINTKDFQAVFLGSGNNNGQVIYSTYFGHIKSISSQYLVLDDVYFITPQSGSKTASNNVQLTQLGCQQIHYPLNQMIINMSQVSFWENISPKGKVASSIASYEKSGQSNSACSSGDSSAAPVSSNPQSSESNNSSTPTAPSTSNSTPSSSTGNQPSPTTNTPPTSPTTTKTPGQ